MKNTKNIGDVYEISNLRETYNNNYLLAQILTTSSTFRFVFKIRRINNPVNPIIISYFLYSYNLSFKGIHVDDFKEITKSYSVRQESMPENIKSINVE